jgi:hypothetical protein
MSKLSILLKKVLVAQGVFPPTVIGDHADKPFSFGK